MSWFPRALAIALTIAGGACASGSGSGSAPPATVSTPPAREPAQPASIAVAYGSGSPTYLITTTATVRAEGDTAAAAESLSTSVIARVLFERTGSRLFVSGSLDSFTVRGSGRLAGGAPLASVRFHGEGSTTGRLTVFTGDTPSGCDSPGEALVAAARDLVVPLPERVVVGVTWRDTVTSTTCRGGIQLITSAIREYESRGRAPFEGSDALELTRRTESTLSGSGTQYGESVSAAGQGTATATLYLDLRGGGLLGSTSESAGTVTFTGPRGAVTFAQSARQQVTRR